MKTGLGVTAAREEPRSGEDLRNLPHLTHLSTQESPLVPIPSAKERAMATSAATKKQQELQLQYSSYKNTLQQLAQKIGDVEQEAEEHKLVLGTLTPVPEDRKCFRLINGILVERTVADVIPALKTNAEGLKSVLEGLVKEYKKKQEEMDKWKAKNNVQVVNQ